MENPKNESSSEDSQIENEILSEAETIDAKPKETAEGQQEFPTINLEKVIGSIAIKQSAQLAQETPSSLAEIVKTRTASEEILSKQIAEAKARLIGEDFDTQSFKEKDELLPELERELSEKEEAFKKPKEIFDHIAAAADKFEKNRIYVETFGPDIESRGKEIERIKNQIEFLKEDLGSSRDEVRVVLFGEERLASINKKNQELQQRSEQTIGAIKERNGGNLPAEHVEDVNLLTRYEVKSDCLTPEQIEKIKNFIGDKTPQIKMLKAKWISDIIQNEFSNLPKISDNFLPKDQIVSFLSKNVGKYDQWETDPTDLEIVNGYDIKALREKVKEEDRQLAYELFPPEDTKIAAQVEENRKEYEEHGIKLDSVSPSWRKIQNGISTLEAYNFEAEDYKIIYEPYTKDDLAQLERIVLDQHKSNNLLSYRQRMISETTDKNLYGLYMYENNSYYGKQLSTLLMERYMKEVIMPENELEPLDTIYEASSLGLEIIDKFKNQISRKIKGKLTVIKNLSLESLNMLDKQGEIINAKPERIIGRKGLSAGETKLVLEAIVKKISETDEKTNSLLKKQPEVTRHLQELANELSIEYRVLGEQQVASNE